jgi:hypothetical protein
MALEFRLHEHNYQNVDGDVMVDMGVLSAEGWGLVDTTIGFPFVHALWSREVGGKPAPADHSGCEQDVAKLTKERDDAREIARRYKAENDALKKAAKPAAKDSKG